MSSANLEIWVLVDLIEREPMSKVLVPAVHSAVGLRLTVAFDLTE